MILSAEEFKKLRYSDILEEQYRASHDAAQMDVWLSVITQYPDLKVWVVHNKTVPIEVLQLLAKDQNPDVRAAVARKRKIDDYIFELLSKDTDENVRYVLMCNTKLTVEKLKLILVSDSLWLSNELTERIKQK